MEREAKSNRLVYESLLQREKELRVSSNSRSNNVRVVDRADVPKSPLAPTGRRTWLMSIAIGLIVAIGVAFGLDYMNDTIKTPEDIMKAGRQSGNLTQQPREFIRQVHVSLHRTSSTALAPANGIRSHHFRRSESILSLTTIGKPRA
jgi:hypothetical protein